MSPKEMENVFVAIRVRPFISFSLKSILVDLLFPTIFLLFKDYHKNSMIIFLINYLLFEWNYNQRENKRLAKKIISLIDSQSLLLNHPEDKDNIKRFNFDHIYWSHDGFTEANNGLFVPDDSHLNGKIYADQVGFLMKIILLSSVLTFVS